jgi:hypothetical protein
MWLFRTIKVIVCPDILSIQVCLVFIANFYDLSTFNLDSFVPYNCLYASDKTSKFYCVEGYFYLFFCVCVCVGKYCVVIFVQFF